MLGFAGLCGVARVRNRVGKVSVEETPEGRFRARWRVPGEANPRSKTFPRRIEAERHERKVRHEIEAGVRQLSASRFRATVADTADDWLAASRGLARATAETYRRDLDRYILPVLGSTRLSALAPEQVDSYISARLAAGAAGSSVRRERATLSRLCSWAVARGHLAHNPVELTDPPPSGQREMRFLTATEVEGLASAIAPRYRALVLVGAWGGLRWSEMVGLRPQDVRGNRIHVSSQLLRGDDGSWYQARPKSKAGVRRVPLPASVAGALSDHMDQWAVDDGPQGPLVFPTQRSTPIISSSWRTAHWAKAITRAELTPRPRPHDLRHTAVALAIAAGAHPKAIQARMGHSSITVTLDRYGHLFPDLEDTVAEGLEALRRPDR